MSNTPLTIVANITARKNQIELVKKELQKLIEPSRAEKGCLSYELYQDNDNPAHFVFYETWESEEDLKKHMESEHTQHMLAETKDALDKFLVIKLTKLPSVSLDVL